MADRRHKGQLLEGGLYYPEFDDYAPRRSSMREPSSRKSTNRDNVNRRSSTRGAASRTGSSRTGSSRAGAPRTGSSRRPTSREAYSNTRSDRANRYADGRGSSRTSQARRGAYVRESQYRTGPYGVVEQKAGVPRLPLLIVGVLAIVLVAFLVVNAARSCSPSVDLGQVRPAVFKVNKEGDINYSLDSGDVLSLPSADEVQGASLSSSDSGFVIGSALLANIKRDIAAIEKTAPCGFVFMDVSTGRAMTYNAGETLYVASASKAPLVYYAITHPAEGDAFTDAERENAEEAIVWSDNDCYFDLCKTYFHDEYLSWLLSFGIEDKAGEDDYFPEMSPRELGAVWAEIYQYIQSGSSDANWFANLFSTTEESYIRSGLANTGATVLDKAGWMYDADVSSVTDAGIVQAGGRTYLMVIVTEQSEMDDNSRQRVSQLARDLYDARGMLAPHITVEV